MRDLVDILSMIGSDGLSWFWVPLLIWTILAVSILGLLRLWKSDQPIIRCNALTALLLSLPLGLLLPLFVDFTLPVMPGIGDAVKFHSSTPGIASQSLMHGTDVTVVSPWSQFSFWIGFAVVMAALVAIIRLAGLVSDAIALHRFKKKLRFVDPDRLGTDAQQLVESAGIRKRVRFVLSEGRTAPATLGWRRPIVIIPMGLLEDRHALHMTLLHELVHIRRSDYFWSWIERVVAELFAIHPVVWLLRLKLARYRELACDAEVLARSDVEIRDYAQLLLQTVVSNTHVPVPAMHMAHAYEHVKARILALDGQQRDQRILRITQARSSLLGVFILIVATTVTACSGTGEFRSSNQEEQALAGRTAVGQEPDTGTVVKDADMAQSISERSSKNDPAVENDTSPQIEDMQEHGGSTSITRRNRLRSCDGDRGYGCAHVTTCTDGCINPNIRDKLEVSRNGAMQAVRSYPCTRGTSSNRASGLTMTCYRDGAGRISVPRQCSASKIRQVRRTAATFRRRT